MAIPPTIQRQASPRVRISPYALVSVHATPGATVVELRPFLERWTGAGEECTSAWEEFAQAHRLVAQDDQPFCAPDFAFASPHRWVAVAVEAPTELHVYAGLCAGHSAALPDINAVAERAAELIKMFDRDRPRRSGQQIRAKVHGSMFIRGALSGHEYHPAKSYLEIAREPATLKEAIPLFAASYGGLFSSRLAQDIPLSSYFITLGIGVAAYLILGWMRWTGETNEARWISRRWPD
jgi:hypothetical protein